MSDTLDAEERKIADAIRLLMASTGREMPAMPDTTPTMQQVQTSADLEMKRILEEAGGNQMTPDELFEQKVSWVYGQIAIGDPSVTKEEVRKRLEANR